jgi:hypothetical protein
VEQLTVEAPIEMAGRPSPPLHSPSISAAPRRRSGEQDDVVYLTGRPVEALNAWMAGRKDRQAAACFERSGDGARFRSGALDPQSVNAIFKQRAAMAGLEPGEFSAHGLRSGYLTEAANRGIPAPRGDGAVTPPIGSAGVELLQQCYTEKRASGRIVVGSDLTVRIARARSIRVLLSRNL